MAEDRSLIALRRKDLVNELIRCGIKDKNVLNAINTVKREFFVNEEFRKYAYDNNALPIGENQTISQPYTVAFMTELLSVKDGDKILEIGTGSGYQAAVISALGAEVYSIERIEELYKKSESILHSLGYKIKIKCDDGTLGWEEFAPYDGIIVTAGTPKIPQEFIDQLKPGGRLVIPIGDRNTQRLVLIQKSVSKDNKVQITKKEFRDFKFVPLVWDEGWRA
jgi:protein-L-isoaspartate(D-aspartate) O-methyltransferase